MAEQKKYKDPIKVGYAYSGVLSTSGEEPEIMFFSNSTEILEFVNSQKEDMNLSPLPSLPSSVNTDDFSAIEIHEDEPQIYLYVRKMYVSLVIEPNLAIQISEHEKP